MTREPIQQKTKSQLILLEPSLIDLSTYNSHFDRGKPGWYVALWWLVQAIAFPLSLHNFNSFRCFLLRLFGAKIGKKVVIRPSARFTFPWKVEIGDYSWIGDGVSFYSLERITVGSHSVVSQKTYLCTGSHDITSPDFSLIVAPIIIGNGTWIATDCFVGQGVTIGSNSIIGAKSNVMKNISSRQIAWGNPCLVRCSRTID